MLEGDAAFRGLDYQAKLRLIAKDIGRFKGKAIDGEPKVNLLLYVFRESKALKEHTDRARLRKAQPQRGLPPSDAQGDEDSMWIGSAFMTSK